MAEFEKAEGKRKNVPRRDFLVSGAVMTAGAPAAAAGSAAAALAQASQQKIAWKASMRYLAYNSRQCVSPDYRMNPCHSAI
jgi:hypothetical protein